MPVAIVARQAGRFRTSTDGVRNNGRRPSWQQACGTAAVHSALVDVQTDRQSVSSMPSQIPGTCVETPV